MAVQEKCWAPSAIELRGSDSAIRFGRKIAEGPINADFLVKRAGGDSRFVYFDDLSDNNYFLFLVDRNNPSPNALERMKRARASGKPFRRPDIVLHHPVNGREYYEIKPASNDGLAAAREKLPHIDTFLNDAGLTYARGTSYPPAGSRPSRVELKGGPKFVAGLAVILRRARLRSVKVVLKWDRFEPGVILYSICVAIESDDELEELEIAFLSGYLVQMLIASLHPEEMPGFVFPQDNWAVEIPAEIGWMKEEFIKAARARLVGSVPGDEWQILCEQAVFDRLVTSVRQWPLALRQLLGIADLQAEWQGALGRDRIERRQKLDDLMVMGIIVLAAGAVAIAAAPAAGGAAVVGGVIAAAEAPALTVPGALAASGLAAGTAANDVAVGAQILHGTFRAVASSPATKALLGQAACFAVATFIGENDAKAAVRGTTPPPSAVKAEKLLAVRRHGGSPFARIELGGDTKVGGKGRRLTFDPKEPDMRILAVLKYT